MDRGEVVTFQTPSGKTKLVLHTGARLDVYAPTGEYMYSAQRINCSVSLGQLQMMCYETGLFKKPILGVPEACLQMIGCLADRAAVVHNIWDQLGIDSKQMKGRKKSRIVKFICPACTYANTSGGVCRMCGALKPEEADSLPGHVGDDTPQSDEDENVPEANVDVPSPKNAQMRIEVCDDCGLSLAEVPLTCLVSGRIHPLSDLSKQFDASPSASPRSLRSSSCSPSSRNADKSCPVCNEVWIFSIHLYSISTCHTERV